LSSSDALVLLSGSVAPLINRRLWRGATCIPNFFQDGERLWTAAYGTYSDEKRRLARDGYRARGYTHFVYNCAGLPYGDDYPELADDINRVARDLRELADSGLVGVVCATDDRQGGRLAQSVVANGAAIQVCFPGWEFNGWLDTEGMKRCIADTRHAAPNADCYIHFTPGHGSISADEIAGWRWCQAIGVVGLLSQDDHWDDPRATGEGLESTALRLAGKIPVWAGMDLLNVAFEQCTTPVYHGWPGWDEARQRAFATEMLKHCPSAAGFCDGGTV
jgi:hypothetical protein